MIVELKTALIGLLVEIGGSKDVAVLSADGRGLKEL